MPEPGRRAARLGLVLGLALPFAANAVQADADREIRGLIAALGQSPCRFQRNGSWHDARRAAGHLQRKYDYLRGRDLAGTPEQFIERAASRSSVSGRAYRVACPGKPEQEAGPWFRAQLQALRDPHGVP